MSTLGCSVMNTTGRPSGQDESPVKCDESIFNLFRRFSVSNIVRLKLEPCCFSRRTSKMFFLSHTDVLMDVILLYVGGVLPMVGVLATSRTGYQRYSVLQ